MSKEDIFNELIVIRDMLPEDHEVHQALQLLVWQVGGDIGECFG